MSAEENQIVASIAPFSLRLRSLLGVYGKDWLRYSRQIGAPGREYLAVCNRGEALEAAPSGEGYRCQWQWTSTLRAPCVVPHLGLRLMRRAISDHAITRAAAPAALLQDKPDVSFVIGHRGTARLAQLQATLESIAAQQGVSLECIVVEQDIERTAQAALPPWVRYVHTPPSSPDAAYCRSWGFNVGARHARGRLLVLHDNDMLVPQDYAASLLKHFDDGHEVINLKRFVFYLSEQHTAKYLAGEAGLLDWPPDSIVQNLEAGGSVAIGIEAYQRIGGMDESFIGWGGEDNEFWERAQTLRVWPYAYLPIVHLWHSMQPGKEAHDNPALKHYRKLSAIPASERIAQLLQIEAGQMRGPARSAVRAS
jgi:hypothetical protein